MTSLAFVTLLPWVVLNVMGIPVDSAKASVLFVITAIALIHGGQ